MTATVHQEETTSNSRPSPQEYAAPEVNIFETKDGYVLEVEMPGVGHDGVDITLEGNEITIVGQRSAESTPGTPIHHERPRADFRRTFELDPVIDTAGATAKIEQGVLTLTLPKSERVKPRKIAVS